MAGHTDLGKLGETLAARFLEKRNHRIVARNWRKGKQEIDLVTTHKGVLHFVEVKTRTESPFGFPEESVNRKKFRYLAMAAEAYMAKHPGYTQVQFDILSISICPDRSEKFFFIEDVFI